MNLTKMKSIYKILKKAYRNVSLNVEPRHVCAIRQVELLLSFAVLFPRAANPFHHHNNLWISKIQK